MSSETAVAYQRRTVRERLARAYEQATKGSVVLNIKLAHSVFCARFVPWDQFYAIATEAAAETFKLPWTHYIANIGFSTCIVFMFVQQPALPAPHVTTPLVAAPPAVVGPPVYEVPKPPKTTPLPTSAAPSPGGPLHYKHMNPLAAATSLPN